jgi:hypothetical protein
MWEGDWSKACGEIDIGVDARSGRDSAEINHGL